MSDRATELVEPIDEHWKKECLENIFGDEPIAILRRDHHEDGTETEYELECVLRRKPAPSATNGGEGDG